MIKKTKDQKTGGTRYTVFSEKTGREFGTYKTRKEAEKRLRQIEMFKHMKKK